MQKKYIVRLTDQERSELQVVMKKLKGTSQNVKRVQILRKADAEFAAGMEAVPEVYEKLYDPQCPVICMTNSPFSC